MTTNPDTAPVPEATIEADPDLPIIRITRDFNATVDQLFRAHTDPDLFARWIGPENTPTAIDHWNATAGGSWRFTSTSNGEIHSFRGCFHDVRPDRIVQTFTWEGLPDDVALETLRFEDLGQGRTRLHAQSLVDSFEGRDAWLRSGMEVGVNQGYAKLDRLLAAGISGPDLTAGDRYERAADGFAARVRAMAPSDWDADSPCEGWTGRDVVNHVTEWIPALFSQAGLRFEMVDGEDPVDRWHAVESTLRRALDDAAIAESTVELGPLGPMPLAAAIDMIVTPDLAVHSWDLARAGGLDDTIDPDLIDWMLPMTDSVDDAADEAMRASGRFGPRIQVEKTADPQTRVLAFFGRAR